MPETSSLDLRRQPAAISRRERKKSRTRSEIYSAAMTLFLKRGFDGVTIDDMCRAADVARATFFLHFPAKDALLVEYGDRANAELAAAIREFHGTATATLKMALRTLAERAARHPEMVRMLVREIIARPRVFREHDERTADLIQLLAAVIRRGQASGEFRKRVDPAVAALVACAAWFALIYAWERHGGKIDIEAAVTDTLEVILNGLSERKPKRG